MLMLVETVMLPSWMLQVKPPPLLPLRTVMTKKTDNKGTYFKPSGNFLLACFRQKIHYLDFLLLSVKILYSFCSTTAIGCMTEVSISQESPQVPSFNFDKLCSIDPCHASQKYFEYNPKPD